MLAGESLQSIGLLLVLAAAISYGLTHVARAVAFRWNLLDRPDNSRKNHLEPTPVLGGLSIYLTILLMLGIVGSGGAGWIGPGSELRQFCQYLVISSGLLCLLGLWDDRFGLRARDKFLLQLLACLPFVLGVRQVETVHVLGMQFSLGWTGFLFTLLWLVSCTNAINLTDGMDGLAATVSLVICLALTVHALMQGDVPLALLPAITSCSILGFLLHNLPPARIFLGDSGSLTIGFLVGALSIEGHLKTTTGLALVAPVVLVSIPAFDTLIAILRRKLNGRGIGEGDRQHFHHCLQQRGLSRGQSLAVIAVLSSLMAAGTLLSAWYQSDVYALATCLTVLATLILTRVFGHDELSLLVRHMKRKRPLLAAHRRWRVIRSTEESDARPDAAPIRITGTQSIDSDRRAA